MRSPLRGFANANDRTAHFQRGGDLAEEAYGGFPLGMRVARNHHPGNAVGHFRRSDRISEPTSALAGSRHAPNRENGVMGHKRSIAPQQTAPLFDLQTNDAAHSYAGPDRDRLP